MATKKDFSRNLLFIMVGIGIIMGSMFPFFNVLFLNISPGHVLTISFFSLCIGAGVAVGLLNFFVFKGLIYNFLEELDLKLNTFRKRVSDVKGSGKIDCDDRECFVNVNTSDPIIGNIGSSFNEFVTFILHTINADILTNNFLEKLTSSLTMKDISQVVTDSLVTYFGADGGCLIGYEHGEFSLIQAQGVKVSMDELDRTELKSIMLAGRTVLFDRLDKDPVSLNIVVGEIRPAAIAFIPLSYQENHLGICILVSRGEFRHAMDALESKNFINQANPFLYNRTLIKRLERFAAIDELTGVYNRRFGMKRLNEEFERSKRHSEPLSICMFDVDNFKQLNDTYGHQAGDYVLNRMAGIIEDEVRVSDFLVRYGGEEFIIVLPGASLMDAYKKVEYLRQKVAESLFTYGSFEMTLSFSAGVCAFPSIECGSVEKLIELADLSLYKAKKRGRNKVVMHPEAVSALE